MAASAWQKALNFFGWGEVPNEDYEEQEIEDSAPRSRRKQLLSLPSAKQTEIVVLEPVSYEDVQAIADHLKTKQAVVVNLQNVDAGLSRRIIDFTTGVMYALDGNFQKVSEDIFLFAPPNVDIIAEKKEEKEKGFFLRD